jgi:hypothetical protein
MTAIRAGISAHRGRRPRPWFPPAAARTARGQRRFEAQQPLLAPGPVGEHERDVLIVSGEKQQEGVVADPVTATVRIRQRVTVEEDAEGFGESCLPVVRRHLGPVRPEPPDVGQSGIEDGPSFEEATPPENWMPVAEGDKLSTEVQKLLVSVLPVEPGKLVVLTVGIVVATLRMAEFVTVPHHGDALAHQEGRYQRAPAALAYLEDRRVVGRAFRAAVPRAVVVSSVVVVLAVRLVVLAV